MTEYNFNYYEKMVNDLLEQFRGRKNIGVVVASYARQLQEVYEFLLSLLNLLDLDACTGAQLDIIGEIVVLSRYDARVMVEQSYEGEVLDDDLYRKLLKWKILLNTNDCTYWSIMKGIKMFWFYLSMPLGLGMMLLNLVANTYERWKGEEKE